MSSQSQSLSIAVIGAGIAGLTAVLSLHKHGHHITVFEQSRFTSEIGAAFHITPNACAILTDLGIDPAEGGAVHFQEIVSLDDKTGQAIAHMPKSGKFVELPKGEDWVLAHRYFLQKQLKDATIARGIELITNKRVSSVQPEKHEIIFREALQPEVHPLFTNWAASRFIIERADIDKHASAFGPDMFQPGTLYLWGKPETRFLAYPTLNEKQWKFVCIFPTKTLNMDTDHDCEYGKKAPKDQLLYVYRDFEPQVQALMQLVGADHLRCWSLMDMKDLLSYVSGEVALIGDSAHPFLPFAYQGAGLAIEDGAAIRAMLEGVSKPEEVAARLKLFEELRHERCSMEQQISRDMFKDHSKDLAWTPAQTFENIYPYRVLKEAKRLKELNGLA